MSLLARPEGGFRLVGAPPCHIRNLRFKALAEPVRDQHKDEIIRGGHLHIGVDGSLNSTNDKKLVTNKTKTTQYY